MRNGKSIINRILGFSLSSWINCIISFVTTPIVTALFPPEELGKINLFMSYANIIVPFIYLGFDQAYVRFFNEPLEKNDEYSLGKLCICISTFMFGITGVIVLIQWKYFSVQIIGYKNFVIVISLIVFLLATYIMRYMNLNARMKNNVLLFSIQSMLVTIITKVAFVIVVIVKPSAEYAIILRSFLYGLSAIIFLGVFIKTGSRRKIYIERKEILELSKFAIPLFPTMFLVMLNTSLSQLMLKKYMDYRTIGIYSNAVTIANIIIVLQSGLNTFWTPFVYEYYKKEQKKLQEMHHIISFLLIGFAILLVLLQTPVYDILVDEQYWESKGIFAILLISPVCITISETLGIGVELSKKTYLKFPVYVVNIVVNFISCILFIPQYGALGAALATGASAMVMMITKACIGERFYKCSDNYWKLVGGMGSLSVTCLCNYIFEGNNVKYIIAVAGLVVVFCVYRKQAKLIKSYGIQYLKGMGKKSAD